MVSNKPHIPMHGEDYMSKLTLIDFQKDLDSLKDGYRNICHVREDLERFNDWNKISCITYTSSTYDKHLPLIEYSSFPHKEFKTFLKDYLLRVEHDLVEHYESAFSDFKKKYENIGLDFTEQLKELRIKKMI